MIRTGSSGLLLSLLAALALLPSPAGAELAPGDEAHLPLSSELSVAVRSGREIELWVKARERDTYAEIARRVGGRTGNAAALAACNDEKRPVPGRPVRVPLALLNDELRGLVLRNLFPEDRQQDGSWIHVARSGALPLYDEGLWQVSQWFSRAGTGFEELMRANGLTSPELRRGQEVRIPAELVHPAFAAGPRSEDGALEYGADPGGPFALYRLKRGEALYSSVIVRFTGRTGGDDVRAVAEELGRRNDLVDLRDIPVGYGIKIPLDLLEPLFLPGRHPRRIEAESRTAELERALAQQPVAGTGRGLRGVVIVLDPGHGGRDLGTQHNGVWEHDYVYDVTCRLRQMLETETAAEVHLTLVDKETGCAPSEGDRLVANRQGTILTDPQFLARRDGEARIGVNLRWYLANSIYRRAVSKGVDADRIVFMSLHADSRHPSLRGLMVYVPGADYRSGNHGNRSSTYRKYKEVREKPQVNYSKRERVRSEAVSRKLADSIVEAFERTDLPVQPYQPIRNKVIRGQRKWLPAVLRGNAVPNKVLVEMVNLSNGEDARLLGSARRREDLARALLDSLYDYFGENSASRAAAAD